MIRLVHPSGIDLDLELVAVRTDGDRTEIDVVAPPDMWSVIDGGLLFHLDDPAQTGGLPPVTDAGLPVEFTLRLRPGSALPGDATPEAVAAALREGTDDTLRDADHWYLVELRQPGASLTWAASYDTMSGPGRAPVEVTVTGGDVAVRPSPLLELAASVLDDVGMVWEHVRPDLLRVGVTAPDVAYSVLLHTVGKDSHLAVYATSETLVPPARRPAVMELVTRINPLLVGTWLELELETGVVSARGSLLLEGISLRDGTFVENVVSAVMDTIERFWPAVHAVAFEGLEPSDFDREDAS